jgi:hypothetical protein
MMIKYLLRKIMFFFYREDAKTLKNAKSIFCDLRDYAIYL